MASPGPLKVLGVGLSRTGTTSLTDALEALGYRTKHYENARINDVLYGKNARPDWRRFDDFDALTDVPTSYFYREILDAYPDCKAVLTLRNEDDWWRSMVKHYQSRYGKNGAHNLKLVGTVRNIVYGSIEPKEYLYRKVYREHNERVLREIPADRLLVMDITCGDGWESLCGFLGHEIPGEPFPHKNASIGREHETIKPRLWLRARRRLRKC